MLPGKAGSRRAASSTSKDSDVSSAFQIWRELQSARPQAARNSVGSMARARSNSYLHKSYMKLCSALRPSTKCAAALELADEKEKLCTLPRAEVGQSRSSLRSHGSTSGASRNGFSTQLAASIPIARGTVGATRTGTRTGFFISKDSPPSTGFFMFLQLPKRAPL